MSIQKSAHACTVFAFMVPLTLVSFWLAIFSIPASVHTHGFEAKLDQYIAIALCCSGVFLYNWFEEKKQKTNVEEIQL